MNYKKFKKDKQGALTTIAIVAVIAILAIAGLAAYFVVAYEGDGGNGNQPPKDDDVEDPIIGYLDLSVMAHFENPSWGDGASVRFLEENSITCVMTDVSPDGASFLDKLMKMLTVEDDDFTIKYEVKCPAITGSTIIFSGESSFNMRISEGDVEHHTVHSVTGGIRYHSAYVVTMELYWAGGDEPIDSLTQTFNI